MQHKGARSLSSPKASPLEAPVAVPADDERQGQNTRRLADPRPDVDIPGQGELSETQPNQHSRVDAEPKHASALVFRDVHVECLPGEAIGSG